MSFSNKKMGLTKEYLRYIPAGNFNIVASPNCNSTFVVLNGQEGRYVAVGACEHIIVYDLRLGEQAQVLPGEKAPVTRLCFNPSKQVLAAGYTDGTVQIYDLETTEVVCVFSGHRSEVTALAYDGLGHRLASGGKDNDVIVWDTVSESGFCRLTGHRAPVTQIVFMSTQPVLISSGKDSLVKLWDLNTQYCFKTIIGHRTEVWDLCLVRDDKYLVTGCGDAELRVWKLTLHDTEKASKIDSISKKLEMTSLEDTDDPTYPLQCYKTCSILRGGRGRVTAMATDPTQQLIGCLGTDNQVELFYFCTDTEAQARLKKRLKKESRAEKRMRQVVELDETRMLFDPPTMSEKTQLSIKDEVKRLPVIKLPSKPKSLHLVLGSGELRVFVSFANNTVTLYTRELVKNSEAQILRAIKNHGHRTDVRAVSFSSDNLAVASGSGDSVKLWNRQTLGCLRTVKTGYVLSTIFVPGDRHVLVGLKDGRLLIIDIAAGDILEEIPAHSSELWTIHLQPDLRGCVTGGGDHTVKFWQFELVVDESSESKAKVLSLLHNRTLKLEETVLCVRISPNGKFVAAALLDSTVKIFFVDTFKFYLSLYGHKLPVLCMDISSDSKLIATGSADRNVKIWGMDFGDCHKSLFAHDDSITGIQFVPRTHCFFTCGKDGQLKEWDGDSFDKIITLQGHVGEAWGLAVSPSGQFVVTCGADRVLRMYERSDQPLVLEDEAEEERAQAEGLATGEQTVVPGHPGLNLPSKKTIGSEKGAESIMECLEICQKHEEGVKELHPLMQAYKASTPHDFLLETIKRIRASDLQESLLLLPFPSVCELIQMLPPLLARGDQTELVCKLTMFLLKIHHRAIVANHALLNTLHTINELALTKTQELRDLIGVNLHGLQFIQRDIEKNQNVQLFGDATYAAEKLELNQRQRDKLKRKRLLTLNM